MPRKPPPKETRFAPGKSGNPRGRPKKLPKLDVLLAETLGEERDGLTAAQAILRSLVVKATRGDVRAAEVLLDRAFGKAKQTTELTGAGGEPLIPARVDLVLVRPKDPAE